MSSKPHSRDIPALEMVTSGERDGRPRINKLVGAVTAVAVLELSKRATADPSCGAGPSPTSVRTSAMVVAACVTKSRRRRRSAGTRAASAGRKARRNASMRHVQLVDGLALARRVEERAPRTGRSRGKSACSAPVALGAGAGLCPARRGSTTRRCLRGIHSVTRARAEKLAGAPCST